MNHFERIEAAIRGEPTDRTPISLWRHWPVVDQDPRQLADAMVQWQRAYDFDLVKFMPTGTYSIEDWGAKTVYEPTWNGTRTVQSLPVAKAEDWATLPAVDATRGCFGQQNASLKLAADELKGSVPILQTVFSPLTTARKLAGDVIFEHMRRQPDLFERGLAAITQTSIQFSLEALRCGAHGLFLASQCSTHDVMTEDEYRRFGEKYDRQVLDAVKGKARFNMLHIHGENVMFDLMAGYGCEMLNWHDRRTSPTLREAMGRCKGLLVGGVNEMETLQGGTAQSIGAELAEAVAQTGGRRLMLAPGCVCPLAVPDANYRAAADFVGR